MSAGPGSSRRTVRGLVLGLLSLAAPLGAAAEDAPALQPHPELVRTYYDFGMMEYCRLIDAEVEGGYVLLRQDQLAAGNIGNAADRSAWIDAVVAVDREFLNRGLGGQKNWCRNEGMAAAMRFTTYFRTRQLP